MKVFIVWAGLPDELDFTWEPIDIMARDVPTLLEDYLATPQKRRLKQLAATKLKLH